MSEQPPPIQPVQIHPLDAIETIYNEMAQIAAFLNAVKLVHDINIEKIKPNFDSVQKLLNGLKKYEIESLKNQGAPTNRQARRAIERETRKLEEKIKKNQKAEKQETPLEK